MSLTNNFKFRPANKEELFNLRHAQARNVIERIFGVLKKRWDILNRAPQYKMSVQAQIPAGLAAVHNFIMEHDETDIHHYMDNELVDDDPGLGGVGNLGDGAIPPEERQQASVWRDEIATAM